MKIPTIICERTMFISGYPRHNTGNLEVEVVSFLSHREVEQWYTHNVGNVNGD
jgi:hypothetical protein